MAGAPTWPPGADLRSASADVRAAQARNFDVLNETVEASGFDRHLRFLNYGYRPLPGDVPLGPSLGPLFPNADAAQMLFQLLGDLDIDGRSVVDVGCGRGGNLWLLDRQHQTGRLVGIDVAASSVRLVRDRVPAAVALVGDAERLPLATASVDVLLSVETSCAYADLDAFLAEVTRVIRPGGWFLHADLLPLTVGVAAIESLATTFEVVATRDITANVVAARHHRAERQGAVFTGSADEGSGTGTEGPTPASSAGGRVPLTASVVAEYLGTDRSGFGQALASGDRTYRLSRLRRTSAPCDDRQPLDVAIRRRAAEGAAETARLLDADSSDTAPETRS
jgi:SAM-dependent methyltransferase